MKIYKIAFNINKDDLLASRLSKEIFEIIKNNIGKNIYKEINVDERCVLCLETFNKRNIIENERFFVRALLDYSAIESYDPSIQVNIYFSNEFSQNDFNVFYGKLVESIGHEIGHYYQYRNNRNSMSNSEQEKDEDFLNGCKKLKEFLLSEMEIIPYIKGIMTKSKKTKTMFETLLNENLNYLLFENNNDFKEQIINSKDWLEIDKIISEIKNTIIDKAKSLYPHLRSKI